MGEGEDETPMKPETREHLLRLVKLAAGWVLFMGATWLLLSYIYNNVPDNGKGRLTTFQSILNTLFILPSWGLPIMLSFAQGGHPRSESLFNLGIGIHFALWMAFWERRSVWAWMKEKSKRQ